METLFQDIRYGVRMLLKKPTLVAVAVVALALGIGANTAVFSVVNAALFRPLPYPAEDRLAMVWTDNARKGEREGLTSYPNFSDFRDQNQSFQSLSAFVRSTATLTGGVPEEIHGANVTTDFFSVMGVSPAMGHDFSSEDAEPGRAPVVVLSHGLWQRRFGSNPDLIGQTIPFNQNSATVIGVMPRGFDFPGHADFWKPISVTPNMKTKFRMNVWLSVIGRLKSNVSREQAQSDMNAVAAGLVGQYPRENEGLGINVVPLREQMVGKSQGSLLLLWAAVALVLLIACANVASLMLTRAIERQKEMAIRLAMGASRLRIIRQLLCENLLLAIAGGGFGLLLAWYGIRVLVALSPAGIPRLDQAGINRTALVFNLGISILTGLVFGLAPALQGSKVAINEALKEGSRTVAGGQGTHARRLLVVTETALTLVLLIGAGLMIKSFNRLQQVDPGFNPDHLLIANLSLPDSRYPDLAQQTEFFQQLEARVKSAPGVVSVGATSSIMLSELEKVPFAIEGKATQTETPRADLPINTITPNYFQTMGISLIKGRAFIERDSLDEANPVVIINETFARRYWPDEEALGKRFKFDDPNFKSPWFTVIGVVRDIRRMGLDAPFGIEAYLPTPNSSMQMVVRTEGDPLTLASAIRQEVWALDKNLPVKDIRTMDQMMEGLVATRRLNMLLLAGLAAVALLLASVGIYSLISYSVAQRTHEIGIRMALGAQARDVLRLVIWQGMSLALAGVGIGLIASFFLTRLVSSMLYSVSATDPATFALISSLLIGIALMACAVPAHRATKIDPMVALRYE
ncbi:MAG TPA: ABC transporter permease [Blastocatellia bacterium]|nr:ABC transporter permease [Blastocatellia bacterium]